MNRKQLNVLMRLCINTIQGKDSFLYSELSNAEIKDAYIALVELEGKADKRALDKLLSMSKDDKDRILNELKELFK